MTLTAQQKKDVIAAAGTTSRAITMYLRQDPRQNTTLRARIAKAIEELGYGDSPRKTPGKLEAVR